MIASLPTILSIPACLEGFLGTPVSSLTKNLETEIALVGRRVLKQLTATKIFIILQAYSITVIYSALPDGEIFQKWQIL